MLYAVKKRSVINFIHKSAVSKEVKPPHKLIHFFSMTPPPPPHKGISSRFKSGEFKGAKLFGEDLCLEM